jgi:hypothetical protein
MFSPRFIAVLGRQPELGLVELESVLGAANIRPFGNELALLGSRVDVAKLGGVIKLVEVLWVGPRTSLRDLPIDPATLPVAPSGKTTFGVSVYGERTARQAVTAYGLELKKALRNRGPVRFVSPTEGPVLSAAQILGNSLVGTTGFELVIASAGRQTLAGITRAVQDIDWYTRRDYGRPVRSAKVGMLPPKLAQILVNTARGSEAVSMPGVYDPFCGTGVVLQEALLCGREAGGSDLASDMVAATAANLAWLPTVAPFPLPAFTEPIEADARTVRLPADCAVVSEGYLGPNLTSPPSKAHLLELRRELRPLYLAVLANFASQLPRGGEVSICVPAWRADSGWAYLDLVDELPRLGYTLKGFTHASLPLLYARKDQIVGRQLLLLRKS